MHKAVLAGIIITFIVILGVALGAAFDSGFKQAAGDFLLGIGGQIYLNVVGAWENFRLIVTANGTNLLVFFLSTLIAGGILWVGVKTLLWDRRPGWMGNKTPTSMPSQPQSQLSTPELYAPQTTVPQTPQPMQPITVPVIVKPIVEEQKKEVTA